MLTFWVKSYNAFAFCEANHGKPMSENTYYDLTGGQHSFPEKMKIILLKNSVKDKVEKTSET